MSIASQISALQTDKTNIATAITTMGGTVASGDGFDDFATDIATIPTAKTEETFSVTPKITSQTVTPTTGNVFSSGTVGAIYQEISTSAGMDAVNVDANNGKMYKYTGTTDAKYTNGRLYIVRALLPIGGRIFYDNGDNGVSYQFFDSSYNEITTQTISGLANAVYYLAEGSSNTKRWYVYDNTNHTYEGQSVVGGLVETDYDTTGLYAGYHGTSMGNTTNAIGSGKTNTDAILSAGVPTDYEPNIWGYAKYCRDNSLNGCNDWFIPSEAEQDQLISVASTLGITWYDEYYIWSSVEKNANNVYAWVAGSNVWSGCYKYYRLAALVARAF